MRALRRIFIAFAVVASCATPALAFDIPAQVPDLAMPVNDLAGMLSPRAVAQLNRILIRLHDGGGSQMAVLTVPDLGGLTIEEAGIKVADKWRVGEKSGDKGTDRGIILLIAKAERRIRIEVGRGNEGDVPDVIAKRIIDGVITPRFRAGQVDEGVVAGVVEILRYSDPEFKSEMRSATRPGHRGQHKMPFGLFLFLVVALILFDILTRFSGRRFYSGSNWGGHRSAGGFRGGGGFGGGFRGGGGGFGGGGASGGW